MDLQVTYLDKLFPNDTYETSGYVLGNINGDHWCLYMCTPLGAGLDLDGVELSDTSSSRSGESDGESSGPDEDDEEDDVTLEILMTNLDPEAMKPFWRTAHELRAAKEEGGSNVLKEGAKRVYVSVQLCFGVVHEDRSHSFLAHYSARLVSR